MLPYSKHVFVSVEAHFRKEYFEAIDCIKGDLEKRFLQENFCFVQKIERVLIDNANGRSSSLLLEFHTKICPPPPPQYFACCYSPVMVGKANCS